MILFEINRGVENEIEFRGLRGKYVYYTALGVGTSLFTGIILSIFGLPNYIMIVLVAIGIGISTYWGYDENKKYGKWGRTKLAAKNKLPKVLYRSYDSLQKLSK
jgi:Domain of unknown function (DUF4133)